MIEARGVVLNEELVVRIFELAVGDPSPNVRQNWAAHWLEYPLHHILPGFVLQNTNGFDFSVYDVVFGV